MFEHLKRNKYRWLVAALAATLLNAAGVGAEVVQSVITSLTVGGGA